ncbi:DNA mismatch repair protein Msh2 [Halotydeus destructor]|nr:DNA mismatch repair protein Msh2 [Halotydeus destructor]
MATMTLDSNVITSFGLFPKEKMTSRDNKCIYGVLNKCRTAPGQNLLKTMLQAPLVDKDTIERRLDCVEYFVQNGQIRQGLYDHYLRKVPDLRKLHSKFSSKKMTLTDCYKLYVVVEVLPKMKSLFEEDLTDFIKEAFVDDLDNFIESLSSFREMVVDVIDLKNRDENGECMIKAQFSENLKEVRDQIDECQSEMEKLCQRAADDLGIEEGKVKLEMTDNGYVYRITNNFEKCLRGKDKYTLAGKSKNDGVRFTEKKLRRLNDDYMDSKKTTNPLSPIFWPSLSKQLLLTPTASKNLGT